MPRLSETQTTLLSAAAARKNLSLHPPPESLKARGKALERAIAGLVKRGLAAETRARSDGATWRRDEDGTRIGLAATPASLSAIGLERDEASADSRDIEDKPAKTATTPISQPAGRPISRLGGKLGALLAAIEGDGGATIGDLSKSTGWQPHTTRAALTRLRQRGFDIRLETVGERKAYRLHAAG